MGASIHAFDDYPELVLMHRLLGNLQVLGGKEPLEKLPSKSDKYIADTWALFKDLVTHNPWNNNIASQHFMDTYLKQYVILLPRVASWLMSDVTLVSPKHTLLIRRNSNILAHVYSIVVAFFHCLPIQVHMNPVMISNCLVSSG